MKYNNKAITRFVKEVSLPNRLNKDAEGVVLNPEDEVKIKLSTIPVGFQRLFDKVCPKPVPPVQITKTVGGKTEETQQWNDKAFIAEFREYDFLKNMYLVYILIKDDSRLSWETIPTDTASLRKFADEFTASGLSEGDALFLIKNGYDISSISSKEIDEATKGF